MSNKITIVIDGINNSGGTDRVASVLSSLLSQDGFEVTLYSLKPGLPYYKVNSDVIIRYSTEKNYFKKCLDFSKYLRSSNEDVVIIISMGKLSSILIPIIKLSNFNGKIICSDHVSFQSFPFYKKIFKYISYLLSDQVIVLTKNDQELLKKTLGNKVDAISNISPYSDIIPEAYSNRGKIIIAVGRLSYQKNFGLLLDIWSSCNLNEWSLKIIGDGEEKEILESKIKEKKLDNVQILAPRKDIDYWYNQASLLLMTSRYEGLPMVLIEAKNFGLPVISLNCKTGPAEIVSDDGCVVNDSNEFIEKLKLLTSDLELRSSMSKKALENKRKYSKEEILKKWINKFR